MALTLNKIIPFETVLREDLAPASTVIKLSKKDTTLFDGERYFLTVKSSTNTSYIEVSRTGHEVYANDLTIHDTINPADVESSITRPAYSRGSFVGITPFPAIEILREHTSDIPTEQIPQYVKSYSENGEQITVITLENGVEVTRTYEKGGGSLNANSFLIDTGTPDDSIGEDGSIYLNKANGKIYKKISSSWAEQADTVLAAELSTQITNITNLLNTKADTTALNTLSNLVNTKQNTIPQYIKSITKSGTTTTVITVQGGTETTTQLIDQVGGAGTDGTILFGNSSAPDSLLGSNGDVYFNTQNGLAFKKTNGTWVSQVDVVLAAELIAQVNLITTQLNNKASIAQLDVLNSLITSVSDALAFRATRTLDNLGTIAQSAITKINAFTSNLTLSNVSTLAESFKTLIRNLLGLTYTPAETPSSAVSQFTITAANITSRFQGFINYRIHYEDYQGEVDDYEPGGTLTSPATTNKKIAILGERLGIEEVYIRVLDPVNNDRQINVLAVRIGNGSLITRLNAPSYGDHPISSFDEFQSSTLRDALADGTSTTLTFYSDAAGNNPIEIRGAITTSTPARQETDATWDFKNTPIENFPISQGLTHEQILRVERTAKSEALEVVRTNQELLKVDMDYANALGINNGSALETNTLQDVASLSTSRQGTQADRVVSGVGVIAVDGGREIRKGQLLARIKFPDVSIQHIHTDTQLRIRIYGSTAETGAIDDTNTIATYTLEIGGSLTADEDATSKSIRTPLWQLTNLGEIEIKSNFDVGLGDGIKRLVFDMRVSDFEQDPPTASKLDNSITELLILEDNSLEADIDNAGENDHIKIGDKMPVSQLDENGNPELRAIKPYDTLEPRHKEVELGLDGISEFLANKKRGKAGTLTVRRLNTTEQIWGVANTPQGEVPLTDYQAGGDFEDEDGNSIGYTGFLAIAEFPTPTKFRLSVYMTETGAKADHPVVINIRGITYQLIQQEAGLNYPWGNDLGFIRYDLVDNGETTYNARKLTSPTPANSTREVALLTSKGVYHPASFVDSQKVLPVGSLYNQLDSRYPQYEEVNTTPFQGLFRGDVEAHHSGGFIQSFRSVDGIKDAQIGEGKTIRYTGSLDLVYNFGLFYLPFTSTGTITSSDFDDLLLKVEVARGDKIYVGTLPFGPSTINTYIVNNNLNHIGMATGAELLLTNIFDGETLSFELSEDVFEDRDIVSFSIGKPISKLRRGKDLLKTEGATEDSILKYNTTTESWEPSQGVVSTSTWTDDDTLFEAFERQFIGNGQTPYVSLGNGLTNLNGGFLIPRNLKVKSIGVQLIYSSTGSVFSENDFELSILKNGTEVAVGSLSGITTSVKTYSQRLSLKDTDDVAINEISFARNDTLHLQIKDGNVATGDLSMTGSIEMEIEKERSVTTIRSGSPSEDMSDTARAERYESVGTQIDQTQNILVGAANPQTPVSFQNITIPSDSLSRRATHCLVRITSFTRSGSQILANALFFTNIGGTHAQIFDNQTDGEISVTNNGGSTSFLLNVDNFDGDHLQLAVKELHNLDLAGVMNISYQFLTSENISSGSFYETLVGETNTQLPIISAFSVSRELATSAIHTFARPIKPHEVRNLYISYHINNVARRIVTIPRLALLSGGTVPNTNAGRTAFNTSPVGRYVLGGWEINPELRLSPRVENSVIDQYLGATNPVPFMVIGLLQTGAYITGYQVKAWGDGATTMGIRWSIAEMMG